MPDSREQQYLYLVREFPDSPIGHFSLGKLYLEQRRYAEAVTSLEKATQLDASYAAALVSLGDAYAGAGRNDDARAIWQKAIDRAVEQNHKGLAAEVEDRIAELDM